MMRLGPELLELPLPLLLLLSPNTVGVGPFLANVDVIPVLILVVGVIGERACEVVPLDGSTAAKVVATGTVCVGS